MPSLLSLPREIRDEIIDYVTSSGKPAPDLSEGTTIFSLDDHGQRANPKFYSTDCVYSLKDPESYRAYGIDLIPVCHQIRAEVLERMKSIGTTYILDIMVADEDCLWPTWLHVPPRISSGDRLIDSLDIHVRFSKMAAGNSSRNAAWRLLDGINDIVRGFLYGGQNSLRNLPERDQLYGLKTLRIYVQSRESQDMLLQAGFCRLEKLFVQDHMEKSHLWPHHRLEKRELYYKSFVKKWEFTKPGKSRWIIKYPIQFRTLNAERERLGFATVPRSRVGIVPSRPYQVWFI